MAVDKMLDRSMKIEMHVMNLDKTPKTRKVGNSSHVSDGEIQNITSGDTSYLGLRNSTVLRRNAVKTA